MKLQINMEKWKTNLEELLAGLRGAFDRSHCKLSGESQERVQPQHEGGEDLKF